MKKIILATFCIGMFMFSSCYYDKQDVIYPVDPNKPCDTTDTKYSTKIASIISSNCYNCHNNSSQLGGVNLQGYNRLKTYAANGKLINVISWTGASNMPPPPASKLSDCEILIIKSWVRQGYPNN